MAEYYINNNAGVGYIVAQLDQDGNGYFSNRFIRNFGERQTDAIEFRNDCTSGKIDYKRIKSLCDTYTDQPYKYLGKGILRKQQY